MSEQLDLYSGDWGQPVMPPQSPDDVPPEVVRLFEQLTFEIMNRGFTRYSSDAILHRIRWHFHIERGERDFKCNNNWTSKMARWFIAKHPEHASFFETRKSPGQ